MATVPDGYHTLTPMAGVHDCEGAIAWYEVVFGAVERIRFSGPGGEIMHCEIEIGGSPIMLHETQNTPPGAVRLMVFVANCDAVIGRAVASGATLVEEPVDRFYGDRGGRVIDPYGIEWLIATRKEELTVEEMQRRWSALINPKDS
jgi:PhnB protein